MMGSAALRATVGTTGLVSAFATPPARAWVSEAFAIASVVAGMVAANNRKSVLALRLDAIGSNVRLAVQQLASIQHSVAALYRELKDLEDEIYRINVDRQVTEFAWQINAAVLDYDRALSKEEEFSDPDAFSNDYNDEFFRVIDRLEQAVGQLQQSEARFSPAAALLAPSAAFVEYGLRFRLGRSNHRLVDVIDEYIEWFDNILDTDNPSSAASALIESDRRHDELEDRAARTEVGKIFGMKPGPAVVKCVGVNDYKHSHERVVGEISGPCAPGVGDCVDTRLSVENVPPRKGDQDRRWMTAILVNEEYKPEPGYLTPAIADYIEGEGGTGLYFLRLPEESTEIHRRYYPWGKAQVIQGSGFPGDIHCKIDQKDMPDPARRLVHMSKMPTWKSIENELPEFRRKLAEINEERCNFAFIQKAVFSVRQAREQLLLMRETLRG